jgi:hypothetical protein
VQRLPRGVLLFPEDRPRAEFDAAELARLRRRGFPIAPGTGWQDYDARLRAETLLHGDVVTSGHPEGSVELTLRPRLWAGRLFVVGGVALALLSVSAPAALGLIVIVLVEMTRGLLLSRRALSACLPGDARTA